MIADLDHPPDLALSGGHIPRPQTKFRIIPEDGQKHRGLRNVIWDVLFCRRETGLRILHAGVLPV